MKHKKQTIKELMSFFDNNKVFTPSIEKSKPVIKKGNLMHEAKMKTILEKLERKHDGII